ncbi:hypothetical protein HanRHA438_Chr15g0715761 [Helianthus annuus]|nr:hypothetical protein HanIR_Chr15g0765061 [Helianthus annuus]KAJ0845621.1 hypothetical protein HanRHA438_Chr15g0715761 [Helianthus annuus]
MVIGFPQLSITHAPNPNHYLTQPAINVASRSFSTIQYRRNVQDPSGSVLVRVGRFGIG